jgi:hypothetical protein
MFNTANQPCLTYSKLKASFKSHFFSHNNTSDAKVVNFLLLIVRKKTLPCGNTSYGSCQELPLSGAIDFFQTKTFFSCRKMFGEKRLI